MAKPMWLDTLDRICPSCSGSFEISQETLELRLCGPVEKCPTCSFEIGVPGEAAEAAIHIKLHGFPA